jgi:hypothetical protein
MKDWLKWDVAVMILIITCIIMSVLSFCGIFIANSFGTGMLFLMLALWMGFAIKKEENDK